MDRINHEKVVVVANLKEALLALTQTRDELINAMANTAHVFEEGHPTENFRGCTHPDCVELRRWIRENKIYEW